MGDLPADSAIADDLFTVKRAHDAPDVSHADDLSRKVKTRL